ncbi:hypothetical protein EMMF5_001904 [Cystobasidiomycetes sp. EMM_F5]
MSALQRNAPVAMGLGLSAMGLGAMVARRPFAQFFGLAHESNSGFIPALGARDLAFGALSLYYAYIGRPKDAALVTLFLSAVPLVDAWIAFQEGVSLCTLIHLGGAAVGASLSYAVIKS